MTEYDGWYCSQCNKEMNYDDAGVHCLTSIGMISFCSDKCAREFNEQRD